MPTHVPANAATLTLGGTDIGQIKSVKGPNTSRATYDVTPLSATAAKVYGASSVIEGGECTITLMWDSTASTGNMTVLAAAKASTTASAIVIAADEAGTGTLTTILSFSAFVTALSPALELDAVITCEVTLKVTGAVTWP